MFNRFFFFSFFLILFPINLYALNYCPLVPFGNHCKTTTACTPGCSGGTGINVVYENNGPYPTQAAAVAAASLVGYAQETYVLGSYTAIIRKYVSGSPYVCPTATFAVFYYPSSPCAFDADGDGIADSTDDCPGTASGVAVDANGCSAAQWADLDGDGMPEYQDISTDDSCPRFAVLRGIQDISTSCFYYLKIVLEDGTIKEVGDLGIIEKAKTGAVDISINDYPMPPILADGTISQDFTSPCTALQNFTKCGGSDPLPLPEYDDQSDIPDTQTIEDGSSVPENENIEQGVDDTDNTTDSERLTDIVNNTEKLTGNQQELSNDLKAIQNEIINQHEKDRKVIADQDKKNSDTFNNSGGLPDIPLADPEDYAFTAEDAEEKEDIGGFYDSFFADTDVQNVLDESGFDVTAGECYISESVTIFGRTFDFTISFCVFEDHLRFMGQLLLILAHFQYIFIVLRGY